MAKLRDVHQAMLEAQLEKLEGAQACSGSWGGNGRAGRWHGYKITCQCTGEFSFENTANYFERKIGQRPRREDQRGLLVDYPSTLPLLGMGLIRLVH